IRLQRRISTIYRSTFPVSPYPISLSSSDGFNRSPHFCLPCSRPSCKSSLLRQILGFVQKQASYSLLKQLFTKDERIARIDEYRRRIGLMVDAFRVCFPSVIHRSLTTRGLANLTVDNLDIAAHQRSGLAVCP